MKQCPVKNCPAKTKEKIAICVAAVMTLITAALILFHCLSADHDD